MSMNVNMSLRLRLGMYELLNGISMLPRVTTQKPSFLHTIIQE